MAPAHPVINGSCKGFQQFHLELRTLQRRQLLTLANAEAFNNKCAQHRQGPGAFAWRAALTGGIADGDAGVELGGLQHQLADALASARLGVAAAVNELLRQFVHVFLAESST